MKKFLLLIVIFFLLSASLYSIYWAEINNGRGEGEELVDFLIKPGEGVKIISYNLETEKLIKSALLFEIYVWQTKKEAKLQAGRYELDPTMSIAKIVDKLIAGEIVTDEKNITILEGWNLRDMEKYFEKNEIFVKDSFLDSASGALEKWAYNFSKPDFLQNVPRGASLEGYLFPDTYRIFSNSGLDSLLKKMLDNFDKKLNADLKEEIERQGKSIHEIITMASIVEKEVAIDKDMAIVAGLLYKRMEIGMRLEVDSSVNYATGKSDPSVSFADLKIDSPYNTYKYAGLPPGPICNPGIRAIMATIYPEESPYLFYLNRQDTGETIFSKNYEEHLRNKNKYLK